MKRFILCSLFVITITIALMAVQPGCIGPSYRASCKEILDNAEGFADGVYTIDPDGSDGPIEPFDVYCDMTTEGGGWTLLMKSTGDCEFQYTSKAWTTDNVINAAEPSVANQNAKYNSFNTLKIKELYADWPDLKHVMWENFSELTTALNRFQNFQDLGDVMKQFYKGWPQQYGYKQYGFNLTCAAHAKVRWGWMWNNETICSSNDASSGIGMSCDSNKYRSNSMGAWATCCSSKPIGSYPSRVLIWGR